MKISQILKNERSISFEFFPPRNERGHRAFFRSLDRLSVFRPAFVSVTYGAGGSTKEVTEEMVVSVLRDTPLLPMAHLTCSAQTRDEVDQVLRRLEAAGIENVIALRGDPPRAATGSSPLRMASPTRPTSSVTSAPTTNSASPPGATPKPTPRRSAPSQTWSTPG